MPACQRESRRALGMVAAAPGTETAAVTAVVVKGIAGRLPEVPSVTHLERVTVAQAQVLAGVMVAAVVQVDPAGARLVSMTRLSRRAAPPCSRASPQEPTSRPAVTLPAPAFTTRSQLPWLHGARS